MPPTITSNTSAFNSAGCRKTKRPKRPKKPRVLPFPHYIGLDAVLVAGRLDDELRAQQVGCWDMGAPAIAAPPPQAAGSGTPA